MIYTNEKEALVFTKYFIKKAYDSIAKKGFASSFGGRLTQLNQMPNGFYGKNSLVKKVKKALIAVLDETITDEFDKIFIFREIKNNNEEKVKSKETVKIYDDLYKYFETLLKEKVGSKTNVFSLNYHNNGELKQLIKKDINIANEFKDPYYNEAVRIFKAART